MLYKTTRTGSGAGTAIATAAAGERLAIGSYLFFELLEAGPVTIVLKFGSTAIHSPILLNDVATGLILVLPQQTSAKGEALYVDLSADNIDVSVTIDVERLSY